MIGYVYLCIAILAEVIATAAMKALDGFNKPLPLVLVVLGYSVAIGLLSQVVKTIPVGVAYAIWSGMGIVLVSVAALFIYKQKLDMPALLGMALIVTGVVVIQLFSKSVSH
ncbi:small multidrug resistance pump [Pseudomonas duriflava]|uniref:Small multidrug resistance pump n=1 Tax=Pseudomonas duriflava TaxID=459528 RepID=A0A562QBS5_9PSED|nr:multidrug efflux SMR transporter [Pseudomonas duriflava]TWI54215.1 small multidrug resistance pump [Pseudomonas duriflava]